MSSIIIIMVAAGCLVILALLILLVVSSVKRKRIRSKLNKDCSVLESNIIKNGAKLDKVLAEHNFQVDGICRCSCDYEVNNMVTELIPTILMVDHKSNRLAIAKLDGFLLRVSFINIKAISDMSYRQYKNATVVSIFMKNRITTPYIVWFDRYTSKGKKNGCGYYDSTINDAISFLFGTI